MKKNTILQLIIIYIGLIAIYYCIAYAIQTGYFLISEAASGGTHDYQLRTLISYALMGLFGVIIILKSGGISNFVAERSGLDDSITVYSKPQQLLSILIVVVALSHIIDHLAVLFTTLAGMFSDKFDSGEIAGSSRMLLLKNGLDLLLPVLTIIFCRNLTAYFSKNILLDEEDMIIHQDTVEIGAEEVPEEE